MVCFYDQLGSRLSYKPVDFDCSLECFVEDLEEVRISLGLIGKFVLLGTLGVPCLP